ncbi:MAG: type II CAAX endopeptidase family protein [Leptolyngbyaceae cyanobacterium MO_188.B28]|nr:type II CAAX endopeptidase family protein [Leptolyngbyaceae cyanobacterium MO_188.B28]
MTVKRIILGFLTLAVSLIIGQSLISSWNEPQVTNRLQLYQTDLLLQAASWQGDGFSDVQAKQVRSALLGDDPVASALKEYEEVREEAETNLTRSQEQLTQRLPETAPVSNRIETDPTTLKLKGMVQQQAQLIEQLDLRLGILQAEKGETAQALETWRNLAASQDKAGEIAQTARVLTGLWESPSTVDPEASMRIQQTLTGWFRYRALNQLYQSQQRDEDLTALAVKEQGIAEKTLLKLVFIGFLPTLGCVLGIGLIGFLVIQRFVRGQKSLLMQNAETGWDTPWTGEIIWQVLVVGFFFIGQIFLPLLLGALGVGFSTFSSRGRALYALLYYVLMASGGILVLYWSIRLFRPLPSGWFRFKFWGDWPWWGLGGYLAALPLMLGISFLNQQFWQGQGGSNPLLQTVLEEHDTIAFTIFFLTAAIAAPLFEEVLFRGFLLPSLTRYIPVWGAIAASSFIFAAAHLSLSEVLPLTALGSVLGFVYTRSRNLLAPMLLHSAWNSVTMMGLFLLGSGSN